MDYFSLILLVFLQWSMSRLVITVGMKWRVRFLGWRNEASTNWMLDSKLMRIIRNYTLSYLFSISPAKWNFLCSVLLLDLNRQAFSILNFVLTFSINIQFLFINSYLVLQVLVTFSWHKSFSCSV